jgi:hypothetical protein
MSLRIGDFADDYHKLFVQFERDPKVMERFVNTESDIKWAIDRSLYKMADMLDLLAKGKKFKSIKKHLASIEEISLQIQDSKPVTRGYREIVRNILPYVKGTFKTICSIISRLCIKRQKLNDFFDTLSLDSVSGGKVAKISYVDNNGEEIEAEKLPENAIVILALNHDHALMDLASMKLAAKSLGAEKVSVLTNIDVWPMYNFIKNEDETIIFRQEKGIKQRVLDLAKKTKGRFVFAIYPEGDLPYFGAQFPMPSHFGAFSIARGAAVQLKEQRLVYLIKGIGNFLSAASSSENKDFEIKLMKPELVPTDEMTSRDPWIEEKRIEFENVANEARSNEMLDLIDRGYQPGKRIRRVGPVLDYKFKCEEIFN